MNLAGGNPDLQLEMQNRKRQVFNQCQKNPGCPSGDQKNPELVDVWKSRKERFLPIECAANLRGYLRGGRLRVFGEGTGFSHTLAIQAGP